MDTNSSPQVSPERDLRRRTRLSILRNRECRPTSRLKVVVRIKAAASPRVRTVCPQYPPNAQEVRPILMCMIEGQGEQQFHTPGGAQYNSPDQQGGGRPYGSGQVNPDCKSTGLHGCDIREC